MFPALDGEVVQIILENYNGDVERALDHLLAMTAEQSATVVAAAPAPPRAEAAGKRWRRPLPEDFLRLPPELKMSAAAREQSRNDELFARMLANESFRAELARHDELRDAAARLPASGGAEGSAGSWSDALSGLSEAAQTKLAALATRWQLGQQQQQQSQSGYSELGEADDDPYLNSLMPSGGAGSARSRRRDGDDGEAVELGEMTNSTRAKRP